MADNRDKNLDDLLMAYELGMLTEDERRRLELLLLENDELMAEAGSFEEAIRLIKHDPDIRKAIIEADIDQSAAKDEKKKSRLTAFVPVFATAAVILILLIIKPWDIQIRPTNEAVASENRLAIMPFDNAADAADTDRLAQICYNLLSSDLAESRYMQIIPLMRTSDDSVKSHGIPLAVAQNAGARWILYGTIVQEEPTITVATVLTEVATGKTISSREISEAGGKNIFALVDTLSLLIMEDLRLPKDAGSESGRSVADITTHSQKAYFYFLEGKDQNSKAYYQDARASFSRVLEYDSTFAMAHYHLARLTSGEERRYHISRAMEYSYKTGTKEKYLIEAQKAAIDRDFSRAIESLRLASLRFPDDKNIYYELSVYHYNLYQYADAADYANKTIELDPDFKLAYNQLAYAYHKLGDVAAALKAVDQYIALAPDEANPYDSKGDICMNAGMLDEAIEAYEKALAIKPDYYKSMIYLEMLYIFKGDYEKAEAIVKNIFNSPSKYDRSTGRSLWAAIALRQGQTTEALRRLDFGIATDSQEQTGRNLDTEIQFKYLIKAYLYLDLGDAAKAVAMADKFVELHREYAPEFISQWRQFQVQILAECGRYADAERVAAELKEDLDSAGKEPFPYYYAAGSMAFSRGDYETALSNFEKLLTLNTDFYSRFMYARTLHESGRLDSAIREYETLAQVYSYCWPLYFGTWSVKQYYYMGLACEKAGRRDDAAKYYRQFIDLWKNADRPVVELDDARSRLERLKIVQ